MRWLPWLVTLALGCAPDPVLGGSTTTIGSGRATNDDTGPSGTTMATSNPVADATADDRGFVPRRDIPSPFQCDTFEQDCPRGEKCTYWANDGGGTWNATRCIPVAEDPFGPGEPCVVEGPPYSSGLDDCEAGAVCWNVDPATGEGTCVALCVGSADAPTCEDPTAECKISGAGIQALCIVPCDPLQQDCIAGQGCYPIDAEFRCEADASGPQGAAGDPCVHRNECDPGTACVAADVVPDCVAVADGGCCSSLCDITDPAPPCLPGQVCTSWYRVGMAPPGYETVGVCVLR